jgi:hypothetical protein
MFYYLPQMEMTMAKFYGMRKNSAFFFGRWDLGSWFESLPTSQGFGGFYGTVMGHSPGCSSEIRYQCYTNSNLHSTHTFLK